MIQRLELDFADVYAFCNLSEKQILLLPGYIWSFWVLPHLE
jgi:hypothetical protein